MLCTPVGPPRGPPLAPPWTNGWPPARCLAGPYSYGRSVPFGRKARPIPLIVTDCPVVHPAAAQHILVYWAYLVSLGGVPLRYPYVPAHGPYLYPPPCGARYEEGDTAIRHFSGYERTPTWWTNDNRHQRTQTGRKREPIGPDMPASVKQDHEATWVYL